MRYDIIVGFKVHIILPVQRTVLIGLLRDDAYAFCAGTEYTTSFPSALYFSFIFMTKDYERSFGLNACMGALRVRQHA